jgi:hypothetical protein
MATERRLARRPYKECEFCGNKTEAVIYNLEGYEFGRAKLKGRSASVAADRRGSYAGF